MPLRYLEYPQLDNSLISAPYAGLDPRKTAFFAKIVLTSAFEFQRFFVTIEK